MARIYDSFGNDQIRAKHGRVKYAGYDGRPEHYHDPVNDPLDPYDQALADQRLEDEVRRAVGQAIEEAKRPTAKLPEPRDYSHSEVPPYVDTEDADRNLGILEAIKKATDARNFARAAAKLAGAVARRNVLVDAFQFGWQLGELAYPWPFSNPPGEVDVDQGLNGWVFSGDYVVSKCSTTVCMADGPLEWGDTTGVWSSPNGGGASCENSTEAADCSLLINLTTSPIGTGYSSPWEFFANDVGQLAIAQAPVTVRPGRMKRIGAIFVDRSPEPDPSPAQEDAWELVRLPGNPLPLAPPWPSERPWEAPATWPTMQPYPQKWADAAPKSPAEQPSGYVRPSSYVVPILPVPVFLVNPRPSPGTGTPPPTVPPQIVDLPPSGPPRSRIGTPSFSPRRRPPDRRTKEKKINVRSVAGGAWVALNVVSEGLEFVAAIHSALPPKLQTKSKSPYDQAVALWKAWDELDDGFWKRAVAAYIDNQVEDMVYGLAGQRVKKVTQELGISTGLATAIRKASGDAVHNVNAAALEEWRDAMQDWRAEGKIGPKPVKPTKQSAALPVPQLTQLENGSWVVKSRLRGILLFPRYWTGGTIERMRWLRV